MNLLPLAALLLFIALLLLILKHHWEQNYNLMAIALVLSPPGTTHLPLRYPQRLLRETNDSIIESVPIANFPINDVPP